MSSEPQEGSVREQLSAAEGTIVQNEEELCRQRRLLDSSWNPQLHVAVLPQHWVTEEEDLYNQQRNFRVEQEEPEPLQIKEQPKEPEPPKIKEEPEPSQIKEELQDLEPPQIKEEPEPPKIKEESGELFINHMSAAISARSRKRKSKLEATLDAFANKITAALKEDDTDILLKMQAAQHEHEKKMLAMMTRFMERAFPPPQPQSYQANPSHLYSPIPSPTPSTRFPVASSPSPTPRPPFFQDLNRLPFNNTFQHHHLNQPFSQAPGHTQAFNEDPLQPSQSKDDETHYTSF